jgi:hypothetical protein
VPTRVAVAVHFALGVSVLSARDALAGNLDTFMLGNDAAMKGGFTHKAVAAHEIVFHVGSTLSR